MGITADTEFRVLKGCNDGACMDLFMSNKTSIISLSMDNTENLAILIHELCEIEINYLLLTEFIIMPYRFVNCTKKLISKLESLKSESLGDFISVSHLASPYGRNCLIGYRENKVKW